MAWTKTSGVEDLIQQLRRNSTAEIMCVMRGRRFDASTLAQFASSLATNTSLKQLVLSGHALDRPSAVLLGEAVGANVTLTRLALGTETFGDEGLSGLLEGGVG